MYLHSHEEYSSGHRAALSGKVRNRLYVATHKAVIIFIGAFRGQDILLESEYSDGGVYLGVAT